MILFDFKCPQGHIEEHLVQSSTTTYRCSCGEQANRMISPVRAVLDPVSGHFPTATDKWAKAHERAAKVNS